MVDQHLLDSEQVLKTMEGLAAPLKDLIARQNVSVRQGRHGFLGQRLNEEPTTCGRLKKSARRLSPMRRACTRTMDQTQLRLTAQPNPADRAEPVAQGRRTRAVANDVHGLQAGRTDDWRRFERPVGSVRLASVAALLYERPGHGGSRSSRGRVWASIVRTPSADRVFRYSTSSTRASAGSESSTAG